MKSHQLTWEDRRVLTLLATGMMTHEVAARLGLTVAAVREHAARITVKLRARSKLEAVLIALREGLINPCPEDEQRPGEDAARIGTVRGADGGDVETDADIMFRPVDAMSGAGQAK